MPSIRIRMPPVSCVSTTGTDVVVPDRERWIVNEPPVSDAGSGMFMIEVR